MEWEIVIPPHVAKEIKKMDPPISKMLLKELDRQKINPNAEKDAKPLEGDLIGISSIRAGDYRILVQFFEQDQKKCIGLVKTGHRKNAYDDVKRLPEEKKRPFVPKPPKKDHWSR